MMQDTEDPELADLMQVAQQQYYPPQTTGGVLPVQTEMGASPIQPEPVPDMNAPLPVMPRDQIAEALMTSSKPTQAEQGEAAIHRGIGEGTANAVSGLQGLVGLLRPGAANYGQAEAARAQGNQLAAQALNQAPERRKEAIQNVTMQGMLEERKAKQAQMVQALKQQKDMQDPMSSLSLQAQQAAVGRINALQASSSNPGLIRQMEDLKKSIPFMSAARLASMEKDMTLEKLVGMESNERAAGAKNAIEADKNANEAKYKAALLNYDYAKLDADKNKSKNAITAKLIGQQPALVDEIGKLAFANSQFQEAKNMLEGAGQGGKLNSNVAKDWYERARQVIPGATPDPQYLEFWGKIQPNIQQLRLAIEKTVRNNPYLMQQLDQMLPHQGDNTATLIKKLTDLEPYIKRIIGSKVGQFRVDPENGGTVDRSALAQHLAGETGMDADELMRNYLGGSVRNPAQGQQAASTENAKALKWANEHPQDPRAAAIKKKLGVQ